MNLTSSFKTFYDNLSNQFKNDKLEVILRYIVYFLSFLCLSTLPIFTFVEEYNIITNILSVLVALSSFIYILFRGKIVINVYVVCFLILLLYAVLLTSFTTQTWTNLKTMATVYSISLVFFTMAVNFKHVKPFLFSYVVGIFILCIWFLIEYKDDIFALNFERLGSQFGNVNQVGRNIALGTIILGYFICRKKGWYFIFTILVAFFSFFVLITGSRGALFALIIGVCVDIFALFGKKKIWWYILTIVCLIILGVVILLLPPFRGYLDRLIGFLNEIFGFSNNLVEASTSQRFAMLQDSIYIGIRNLFFGGGADYFRLHSSYGTYSHFNIGEMLCNYGLVGLILFYIPFICVLFNKKKQHLWILYISFFAVCIILYSLISIVYYDKVINILFSFVFAQLYLDNKENQKALQLTIRFKKQFIEIVPINFNLPTLERHKKYGK